MNITGPFLNPARKDSKSKWYLSYFVPRLNADGSAVIVDGKPIMVRQRPHYASKALAEADKPRLAAEHHSGGASAFVRSREAVAEFDRAKQIESRVPLDECARFYRLHHPRADVRRVNAWVPVFLEDISTRLGETRHWSDLKCRLGPKSRFSAVFGERIPETITRAEMLAFLKESKKQGRTVLNDKRAVCNFFNWLREQPGALSHNPAGGIKRKMLPRIHTKEIRFLDLAHAERYLRAAERYDPEMVAHEIVQLIAGVRADDEMDNFSGHWVLPATHEVVIPAEHAKTGRREVINQLEENFWEWWKVYGRLGRLRPRNYEQRWVRLRALAAIEDRDAADEMARLPIKTLLAREDSKAAVAAWPWNGRRRTFCTYHVAKHQSAAKTALILRHRGDSYTLHDSYRGTGVTPEQGTAYFEIRPKRVKSPILPEVVRTGIVRMQFEERAAVRQAARLP